MRHLLSAGDLDATFGSGGRAILDLPAAPGGAAGNVTVYDVKAAAGGRVLVAASVAGAAGSQAVVARVTGDGLLDPSFGDGGVAYLPLPGGESPRQLAIQPDGRIVLAASLPDSPSTGGSDFIALRLTTAGAPDATFGTGGVARTDLGAANERSTAVTLLPGGGIALGGVSGGRFALQRLGPNGAPDPSFAGAATGAAAVDFSAFGPGVSVTDVLLQGDKFVLAGRYFTSVGGSGNRLGMVRLTAAGQLDPTFDGDGRLGTTIFGTNGRAAVLGDGRLVSLVGEDSSTSTYALVRYNPDGAFDPVFNNGQPFRPPTFSNSAGFAHDALMQSDGRVVVAGAFQQDQAVARHQLDGSLDPTFGTGGQIKYPLAGGTERSAAADLQADGNILVAGTVNDGTRTRLLLTRLDGTVVPNRPPVAVIAPPPRPLFEGESVKFSALPSSDPDGRITSYEWDFDYDGARFDAGAAGVEPLFSTAGIDGPTQRTVALRVTDSMGESVTTTQTVEIRNSAPALSLIAPPAVGAGQDFFVSLAAADKGPDTVTSWTIDWGDGTAQTVPGGTTRVGHRYGAADAGATRRIAATATDEDGTYAANNGATDVGSFGGGVRTVGDQTIAPGFSDLEVDAVRNVAYVLRESPSQVTRVLPDGTVDAAWGTGGATPLGMNVVGDLALLPDGSVLASGGKLHDYQVVKLQPDGQFDPAFGNAGVASVSFPATTSQIYVARHLVLQPDGKILLIGGTSSHAWARLNPDGSLDPTFGTSGRLQLGTIEGTTAFTSVAALADGRLLATSPQVAPSTVRVFRLFPDGRLDPSFGQGGVATVPRPGQGEIKQIRVQPDGKAIAVGWNYTGPTPGAAGFALRLTADGAPDPAYGTAGVVALPLNSGTSSLTDLAFTPDGGIVASGSGIDPSGLARLALVKLTAAGALDAAFADGGIHFTGAYGGSGGRVRATDGYLWTAGGSADRFLFGPTPVPVVPPAAGGQITGTLFNDLNANGRRDPGKPALARRSVYLDLDDDGTPDAGEPATVTDAAGAYAFTALVPGLYRVRQVLPPDWAQTGPAATAGSAVPPGQVRNVGAGQAYAGVDFGSWQLFGRLSGVAYNDLNLNGVRASSEPVLSARTVYVDANNNGAFDPGETSATTNSPYGAYTFILPRGTYTVRQVLPAGWFQTDPAGDAGSRTASVVPEQDATGNDFGSADTAVLGRIAGVVFDDANANGALDAGEAAAPGRTVYLDADNDGTLDAGEASFVTGAEGYWFDRLLPGTYVVRVVVPAGLHQTAPAGDASLTFNISTGQRVAGANFGLAAPLPVQVTLAAAADAYVRDGTSAATNFGSATQLQVKLSGGTGSTREAYLRFDLAQVGSVTSAVLRLWGTLSADGESVAVGAYPVADVTWGEGTINWNNRPAGGASPVATATMLGTAAKWYEWDLTDYLKQQKAAGATAVTVVLRGAAISAANAAFDSDESATTANRPQLVVKSQPADTTSPALAGLAVGGSAWSAAFRGGLQSVGLGDGSGYALPLAGAASAGVPLLPWTNLDRITLRFSEAVDIQQGDLLITGTRAAGYAVKAFAYDVGTFTATWTLAQPLAKADRLRLGIAAGAVADLAGNTLPAAAFQFNVLPGDATRDGRVNAMDELDIRGRVGRTTASPGAGLRGYSPFADLNGSGTIDVIDYALVRMRLTSVLPPTTAAAATLFSTKPMSLAADLDGYEGPSGGESPV